MPLPTHRIEVMAMTPFKDDLALDEDALRTHLDRLASAGHMVVLTSPINGESHQLTIAEHRRVYEIGVEVCKGRVPVWANTRDSASAEAALAIIREALAAGCDGVQIYQCRERLLLNEQEAYWRSLLERIPVPVRISLNELPAGGYVAERQMIARLADEYPLVVDVWVYAGNARDFYEWRDALPGRVRITCGHRDNLFRGAHGHVGGAINNILPETTYGMIAKWNAGDLHGFALMEQALTQWTLILHRIGGVPQHSARATKAGLKMAGLGNGVLRPPLTLPPEKELAELGREMDRCGLPEWDRLRAMARERGMAARA